MSDYKADLRDTRFILYEQLNVEQLLKHPDFKDYDRETFDMSIDMAYRLACDKLSPLNEVGDQEGCHFDNGKVTMPKGFKEAYQEFCEGGWVAAAGPPEFGGGGLPNSVALASSGAARSSRPCTRYSSPRLPFDIPTRGSCR